MTKENETEDRGKTAQPEWELPAKRTESKVLSGAEQFADGQIHTGVAVLVASDGKPSTLMIPDVTKVKDGAPVYITKPIRINGKNLKEFLFRNRKSKSRNFPSA